MDMFLSLVVPLIIISALAMLIPTGHSKQKTSPYHEKPTNSDFSLEEVLRYAKYTPYADDEKDENKDSVNEGGPYEKGRV